MTNLFLVVFELDYGSATVSWQAKLTDRLAKHFFRLIVLTAKVGDYRPPENVEIIVIPLWAQKWLRPLKAKWFLLPYYLFIILTRRIDCIFVHMHFEWTYRFAPFVRPFGIPIVTWYAHGSVTWRLKLACLLASRLLTSSPEGLRIETHKRKIIGQGVDTSAYSLVDKDELTAERIVVVGRLSPRKRCDLAVRVLAAIHRLGKEKIKLTFIGTTVAKGDAEYRARLTKLIEELGLQKEVEFLGHLDAAEIRQIYTTAYLQLNVSETGSMDKTVLEALSCGIPVLTTNEAYRDFFKERPELYSDSSEPGDLADKAVAIIRGSLPRPAVSLRQMVVGKHDFNSYVSRVISQLEDVAGV